MSLTMCTDRAAYKQTLLPALLSSNNMAYVGKKNGIMYAFAVNPCLGENIQAIVHRTFSEWHHKSAALQAYLRSDAFRPCCYGGLERLLVRQTSCAESVVMEVKGERHACK